MIYLKFSDKYSHDMAMTLLAANQAALMGYLVQIMMIIIIRYLYIFHPGFMNETNDNVVIHPGDKVLSWTWSFGISVLE